MTLSIVTLIRIKQTKLYGLIKTYIMTDFITNNWLELLVGAMAFIKIIVNLTPTIEDNKVFSWIDNIFDAIIPNYKNDE